LGTRTDCGTRHRLEGEGRGIHPPGDAAGIEPKSAL
jgi:hypothetical protein